MQTDIEAELTELAQQIPPLEAEIIAIMDRLDKGGKVIGDAQITGYHREKPVTQATIDAWLDIWTILLQTEYEPKATELTKLKSRRKQLVVELRGLVAA